LQSGFSNMYVYLFHSPLRRVVLLPVLGVCHMFVNFSVWCVIGIFFWFELEEIICCLAFPDVIPQVLLLILRACLKGHD